jgi:uncharacterized delta-60 repeat protein
MVHRYRLAGIIMAGLALLANEARAWQQAVASTAFTPADSIEAQDNRVALAVDGGSNLILAGATKVTSNAGGGYDFVVVKLPAAGGTELWRYTLDGTASGSKDAARAVAVDHNGDVIAVGKTENTGSGGDFTIVKLAAASGSPLWGPVELNTAGVNGFDLAVAVALDADGNALAAGSMQTSAAPIRVDFTVVKLAAASGAVLWQRADIHGTGASNLAEAVAVDGSGNAIAAGFTAAATLDLTVVKLAAANGADVWAQPFKFAGPGEDEGAALALDSVGNVVVAGATENGAAGMDFLVAKLAGATGTLLWPQVVKRGGTGVDSFDDHADAVTLDASGNVYVAGSSVSNTEPGDSTDLTVLKLNADGTEAWFKTVVGSLAPQQRGEGFDVVADLAGNAVVAGRVDDASGTSFVVVRLAADDGAELRLSTLDGPAASSRDEATAVTLDPSGNIAGAGRTQDATGGLFTAVRLGCSGAEPVECTMQVPDDCTFGGGCDPATGQCSTGARPNGSPCDDGDACTQTDACQGGSCTGANPVQCGGECRGPGVCDAATGTCTSPVLADGTACNDGDACTAQDSCQAGTCTPAAAAVVPCAIDGALADSDCAGQKIPRGVKKGLKKAKKLVAKAVGQSNANKKRALLGKASTALGKARTGVDKAARRARKPLAAPCAQALRDAIARALAAIDRLRQ